MMNACPRTRGKLQGQEGAAAVEFALIVGLLLMLVFGIIEFGRVFSELGVLNSAAREGARAAAVRSSEPEVRDVVADAAAPYDVDFSGFSMAAASGPECDAETQGESITVSWSQPIQIDIVLLPDFSKSVPIRGVFRCE